MRVLHISLEMFWGGGEKQLTQLIKNVSLESLLVCHEGSVLESFSHKNGLVYRSIPQKPIAHPITITSLKGIIRNFHPDIIHVHCSKAHSLVILTQMFTQLPPVVVTRRMNNPIKRNILSKYKYSHQSVKKIICVSQAVRQMLLKNIIDSKLTTIYGGIDIQKTQQLIDKNYLKIKYPKIGHRKVIGFIGNLSAVKDPLLFIETAELIKQKHHELVFALIGAGPLKPFLLDEITKRNLENSFVTTGFINRSVAALSGMDILMLTSKNEGIPNVILEAFAVRVPVVSVCVGGVAELIDNCREGILTTRNPKELAHAALNLIENNELSNQLAQAAYQKVQKFSSDKGVAQTQELYREILRED